MATGAFQGFAIKNNLSETTADRQIITNLGGSPLGDDIVLLYNNKRNKSSIFVGSENLIGSFIRFDENVVQSVFSNKTRLTINNNIYYVRDSNGLNEFRLSTLPNLSDLVTFPPIGFYERSDEVSQENITNFSKVRRSTDLNAVQSETLTGFLNQSASILGSSTPTNLLENLEANLDFYKFRRNGAITRINSFLSPNNTVIKGYVRVQDIDNLNAFGLNDDRPGIFIYNPTTGSGVRAFSSNDNPWSQNSGYLESSSNNINVGTLKSAVWVSGSTYTARTFGITLKNSNIAPAVTETTIIAKNNFTHKVPITVNGDTYFLCLRQT